MQKSESAARHGIVIRDCHGLSEFEACVQVERAAWKSADIDVVPLPLFVVAAETGGQVLGAFRGRELVGFTMALAGWRNRRPFLHSHMTAVLEPYRDQGIGRRLKLFQREEALARGIALIEWTFDPLVAKNAYFNIMLLGAIARRYVPNAYGVTSGMRISRRMIRSTFMLASGVPACNPSPVKFAQPPSQHIPSRTIA